MLNNDQKLAVAALDVLSSLSDDTLRAIRTGREGSRDGFAVKVPRQRLAELAEALERAYPGVLNNTLRLAGRKEL